MNFINHIKYFFNIAESYSGGLMADLTLAVLILTISSLRLNKKISIVQFLPIFYPRVFIEEKEVRFVLDNLSDFPAYDVRLMIIAAYSEKRTPHKSLFNKKAKKLIGDSFPEIKEDGIYGITDNFLYYAFPSQKRCTMKLDLLVPPEGIYFYFQFRDSLGRNYLHQGWFFRDSSKNKQNEQELRLGFIKAKTKPVRKIIPTQEYKFFRPIKSLDNKLRTYLHIDKDIVNILPRSFHASFQKTKWGIGTPEDRGIFSNL